MRIRHVLCTAVLLMGRPIAAAAQAPDGLHVFVEAAPLLNRDMTWGHSRVATGCVSLGGGVYLTRRLEIRLLLDLPAATTVVSESSLLYEGTPPVATASVTASTRVRNRTLSAIVSWRIPSARRVAFAPSVGWSTSHRADAVTITTTPLPAGQPTQHTRVPSDRAWSGLVVGAGVVLHLTSQLALLPELRTIWYPAAGSGNTIVRGAIGTRWTL